METMHICIRIYCFSTVCIFTYELDRVLYLGQCVFTTVLFSSVVNYLLFQIIPLMYILVWPTNISCVKSVELGWLSLVI
jgi:cellulose synthase/poly-beta-1,6-N-acetylglucosamine synthase-like glycosyltransferase